MDPEQRDLRALSRVRASALLLAGTLLAGCAWPGPAAPKREPIHHAHAEGALRAGAAVVDVTPTGRVWMGGYGPLRRSRGVRDPISARALVLEAGALRIGFVALDVVGLQAGDRARLDPGLRDAGFDPRHVLVHATHDHAGPDTIGLWGLPPFYPGRSRAAMARLEAGVVEALARARDAAVPAELAAAAVPLEPRGLLRNLRRPGLVDRDLGVVHVRGAGGGPTVGTLTVLGVHPEVFDSSNRLLSADFPAITRARIEAELGGVAVHASGALGGLVAPDVDEQQPREAELERIGLRVAQAALAAVAGLGDYAAALRMDVWRTPVVIPVRNPLFRLSQATRVIRRPLLRGGKVESTVSLWAIGPLRLAGVPGEITPDLGLRVRRAIGGRPGLLIGLADDELGYLLPRADWEGRLYSYERKLSPGPEAGERVLRRLEDLALLHSAALGEAGESTRSR